MKIGRNQFTGMVKGPERKNLKSQNSVADKVSLGNNQMDESFMMAGQLKDMKSFISSGALMKIVALQAGCMVGGAGVGGFLGYTALSGLGTIAGVLGAAGGAVAGGAIGHAVSVKLT